MRPNFVEDENYHKQSIEILPPSCLDCLCCSADGEIAVAAGDCVQVFIPKILLSNYKDEFEESQWYKIRFVTNIFSRGEFPPLDPLSHDVNSIGEEQSTGKVTGIRWSPPGIAKHNRCALAVLTSNHRLSIWASTSNQEEDASWKRMLVVNRALSDYSSLSSKIPIMCKNELREELRLMRSRIRAFTWAEDLVPLITSQLHTTFMLENLNGISLVAVTNDAGELVVVRIRSPDDIAATDSPWTCEVVCVIDLPAVESQDILDPFFGVPRFINSLSWGPWALQDNTEIATWHSKLAYVWNSHLFIVDCLLAVSNSNEVSFKTKDQQKSFGKGYLGSLKWSRAGNIEHLYAVRHSVIQRISFPLGKVSINEQPITSTQELDSTWSTYSGLSVTTDSNLKQSFHLAIHYTVNVNAGMSFEWMSASTISKIQPKWRSAVQQRSKVFDRSYQLNGAVITKVLGLASIPGTDHIGVCFTFHPSNSIEYLTASRAKGTMIFRAQMPEDLDLFQLHNYKKNEYLGDLRLEATVYVIKRWLRYKALKKLDMHSCSEQLISSLLSLVTESPRIEADEKPTTVPQVVLHLRREFNATPAFICLVLQETGYLNILETSDRLKGLLKIRNSISSRLCKEILCINSELYHATAMDRRVLDLCSQLANSGPDGSSNRSSDMNVVLEHCVICNTAISGESFTWSRCANDHIYPRCGLTFQSIQTPGQSKLCGFCNVPYLNKKSLVINRHEEGGYMDSPNGTPRPNANPKSIRKDLSLMDILNIAFNVCLYCGAKLKG